MTNIKVLLIVFFIISWRSASKSLTTRSIILKLLLYKKKRHSFFKLFSLSPKFEAQETHENVQLSNIEDIKIASLDEL